ncbi:hypothetical protein ACFQ51_48310 [Streptomyces kaempferi]
MKTHPLRIGAATNRTVNGQRNPVISIRPGETQLWRLANIGANIYYKLHLPGIRFRVIAQDGIPVPKAYDQDTVLIAAARVSTSSSREASLAPRGWRLSRTTPAQPETDSPEPTWPPSSAAARP